MVVILQNAWCCHHNNVLEYDTRVEIRFTRGKKHIFYAVLSEMILEPYTQGRYHIGSELLRGWAASIAA